MRLVQIANNLLNICSTVASYADLTSSWGNRTVVDSTAVLLMF